MLSLAQIKEYVPKGIIMSEGEKPDTLFYILEGSVSVHMEDEDRHELILAYLGPGDFFGELGLFGQSPSRSAWVRARTDCKVAIISYQRFKSLCKELPELLMQLTEQIANRLRSTSRKISHLAFLDVTGRIARTLLDLAKDSEAITHPDGMMIKITREELGRLVSCSREIAGKVLKGLEEQGLIQVSGRNIVIHGTR